MENVNTFSIITRELNHLIKLDYEIVSSGSVGNCVRIENLLVDCGIKVGDFKKLPFLKSIKNVIITHVHSDHVKRGTLSKLKSKTIYCNQEVYDKFKDTLVSCKKVIVVDYDKHYKIGNYIVKFYKLKHSVDVLGFSIVSKDFTLLYATDFYDTADLPQDSKFDYILLEANYCENKITQIYNNNPSQRGRIKSNFRHCSKQESLKYAFEHLEKGGHYEQLHKSSQYY